MIARSLLLVTALVSAHAAVDCGNGNQCADGQTCLGRLSAPNGTSVGLKYGCSAASLGPTPTLCPAGVYSCPSGDVCVVSKNQFLSDGAEVVLDCAPSANATVTSSAKINPSSTPVHAPRKATICTTVGKLFYSGCSCTGSGNYGAVVDCSYSIPYMTTVGIEFTLTPCSSPARAGLRIYGAGFTAYSNYITASHTLAKIQVPGASVGIPGIAGAGMFLTASVSGNIASIKFAGKLDACAKIGFCPVCTTQCGSYFGVPGLPTTIISGSASFSSICDAPAPTSRRRRATPAPTSRRRRATPIDDDFAVDDDSAGAQFWGDPYYGACRSDEAEIFSQSFISGMFCSPYCQGSAQTCPVATGASADPQCLIEHSSGESSCMLVCSYDGISATMSCPMGAQCAVVGDGNYGACTYPDEADGHTKSGKAPLTGLKVLPFNGNHTRA